MQQVQVKNILLVGRTGAGKSTLSNILCGQTEIFQESSNLKSETKVCKSLKCNLFGNPNLPFIQICDTPGFMDSSGSDCGTIDTIFELLDSIQDDGIHVILFCLSATEVKCDKSVLDTLKTLIQLMGDLVQGSIYVVITQLNKINPQEIENKCEQMKAEVPGILNEAGIQINHQPMFFYYHGEKLNGLEKFQELIKTKESFKPEIADDYKRLYDPQDKDGSMEKIVEQNNQLQKVLVQMNEERQERQQREQQQEQQIKLLQQQQEIDKQQREQEKLKMEELQNKLTQDFELNQSERRKIEEEKEKMQKCFAELKEQRRKQKQIEKEQLLEKQKQEVEMLKQKLFTAKHERNQAIFIYNQMKMQQELQKQKETCQLI